MKSTLTAEQHLRAIHALIKTPRADVAIESQGLYGFLKFTHPQRDGTEIEISSLSINVQSEELARDVMQFLHSNEIWAKDSIGVYTPYEGKGDFAVSGLYYILDSSGKDSIASPPAYLQGLEPSKYKDEVLDAFEEANKKAAKQGANSLVYLAGLKEEPLMIFLRPSDFLKLDRCLSEQTRDKS